MNNIPLYSYRKTQLEILKTIIDICEKLDISYFAIGGTAIGAVRHKGYIPWDDDIDIAMLKEDYEIFVQEAPKFLPHHLFLQTIDSEPNYLLNNLAKIRDSRTTFIETSVSHIMMNHGIYVDIFPCFYTSKSKLSRYYRYFMSKIYQIRLRSESSLKFKEQFKLKLTSRLLSLLLFAIFPDANTVRHKQDILLRSISIGENIILPDNSWGVHGYPRKWFEETIKMPFENREICLPKEYDKYLTATFGNYMQLPPIEQQKSHHFADIIDTEKSYTEYIEKH